MRRRLISSSRSLAIVLCLAASACSGGDGDDVALDDAAFVSQDGVLLDANLDRVSEVALPDGASVGSISDDGDVVFSSSIGATESQDCCGPNMESLFVLPVDGDEPEPLFPGEIGVADRNPDWAPSGERVVFTRWRAPVYTDDGGMERREDVVEGLYVFTAGDDAPRLLVEGQFSRVEWSPDAQLIAATEPQYEPDAETPNVLHIFDAHSGAPVTSAGVDDFRFGWSPSSDRLVVQMDAGDLRSAVGLYDVEQKQMTVVPETETLETRVWVWGSDGPIIELNRSQGRSLLARVHPDDMTVTGLRRCEARGQCPRPVEALDD